MRREHTAGIVDSNHVLSFESICRRCFKYGMHLHFMFAGMCGLGSTEIELTTYRRQE